MRGNSARHCKPNDDRFVKMPGQFTNLLLASNKHHGKTDGVKPPVHC